MTTPWHEDESFWIQMADVLFGPQRWENAPQDVEKIINLVELEAGSSVLDLPCGVGRHALEFARRGFSVTGVDITPSYLEEAGRRADAASLTIELQAEDMRRFSRPGKFDLAINLWSSFGFFCDPEDEKQVVRNLFDSLRPGGHLVMEMKGREVMARNFREREWTELDNGGFLLEHRTVIDDWSWGRTRWIYLHEGVQHDHTFELRMYTASELLGLLDTVGFADVRAYGNLDGDPYDHQAVRLVVTATKPG